MADQSDVETALVGVVGGALYPTGLGGPCAVPDAICRIYRGWPVSAALDADLAAGLVNVSVIALSGQSVNTTRWPDIWSIQQVTTPSLLVDVTGDAATFSGNAGPGQLAALVAGTRATVYRTLRQTRRQLQAFRVTAWCPDPLTRDAIGSAIDSAMSGIDFIGLADGTSGRLRYLASNVSDRWEDAALYRRELTYSVDYPTSIAETLTRMAVGETQYVVNGTASGPDLLS